jgi:hypothetical protein
MKIIHSSHPSDSLERLGRLASCLGIAPEITLVRGTSDLDHALPSEGRDSDVPCAVDVATLANALPGSAQRLSELLRRRRAPVLLFVTRDDELSSRFLHQLTDGSVNDVAPTTGDEVAFAADARHVAGELAGQSFRRSSAPGLSLNVQSATFETLASIGSRPTFGRLKRDTAAGRTYVWSTPAVFDVARPLDAELEFELAADEYLPALMFLRSAFGDRCWHNPQASAALVIDDPLLTRRYGFIDFYELLSSARRRGYRVTLAFIPWNHWRTTRENADFFRGNADVFSFCVHGNDHTAGEFGSQDPGELAARIREALDRMDRHAERTGLTHEPLMVCPQERYSVQALKAFGDSGRFEAVVNSRRIPDDPAARGRVLGSDLLLPVEDSWFGVPIVKRHYADEGMAKFALALFLGRPAVLSEHHGYFQSGTVDIERFVTALARMRPDVKWQPLSEIVRRLCWRRRKAPGVWSVRFFSDVFGFENDTGEPCYYELVRRIPENFPVELVAVNGASVDFTHQNGLLRFEADVPASSAVQVAIRTRRPGTGPARAVTPAYRARVALRRGLSEFRDHMTARNPRAIGAIRALARAFQPSSSNRARP